MGRHTVFSELSVCETYLMKQIWDAPGDIAIPELIVKLKENYGKDYARTTVVTFVSKLKEKGFVRTYRIGKLSYAHALRDEEEYKKSIIKHDSLFWFDGKPSNIMAALCETDQMTEEEVEKIKEILDEFKF